MVDWNRFIFNVHLKKKSAKLNEQKLIINWNILMHIFPPFSTNELKNSQRAMAMEYF